MYDPHPIEGDTFFISPELTVLTEDISESIHDVWGRKRLDQGWVWGSERNDSLHTNPRLVPYSELSELEKDDDRCLVLERIRLILSNGYTIEKRGF